MSILTGLKNDFFISADKIMLQIDTIHNFLSTKAYWCLNIPKDKVFAAIENSLCFGVYKGKCRLVLQELYPTSQQLLILVMYLFWKNTGAWDYQTGSWKR